MQAGDVFEVEIEGLGVLSNPVRDEGPGEAPALIGQPFFANPARPGRFAGRPTTEGEPRYALF